MADKVLTRVFKSGNSLAVRIPRELAIRDVDEAVEYYLSAA